MNNSLRKGIDCKKISAPEIIELVHKNPEIELFNVPAGLNALINLLGLKAKIYMSKKDFLNRENELIFRNFILAS